MKISELLEAARERGEAWTPTFLGAARWTWAHRTLVLAVAVVLLVALNASSCRRAASAEAASAAAAKKAAVEAKAESIGIEPIREAPQAQVDEEGERARKENPVLRARVDDLEKQLGKTRLELAARIRTAPAPVADAPRPPQPAGEAVRPAVLLAGDQLRLGADLQVRGRAGAHLLVGTLEAWRAADDVLLWRQPYSEPVTVALMAPPAPEACAAAPERAWRFGAAGGVSGHGWLAGGLATYRLELWGWRPEGVATVTAGPGGIAALAGFAF